MPKSHDYGDAPVKARYRKQMEALARALDEFLNGEVPLSERKTGFILMVFPFGEGEGRCNYMSNGASREDVIALLKEQLARFEGQADLTGTA